MRSSNNSAASVNKINNSLAACKGIFIFCHTLLVFLHVVEEIEFVVLEIGPSWTIEMML